MRTQNGLTKILASLGALGVWFPLLAPVLVAVWGWLGSGRFNFDYLMPAELFPLALVGGGLLWWAAFRAHSHRQLIGWGVGLAVIFLVAGQVLATLTGLASGAIEPTGWPLAVVMASLVFYTLALVATGLGGVRLLRELFGPPALPRKLV